MDQIPQNPQLVVREFSHFYQNLYAFPTTFKLEEAEAFFQDLPLPKLKKDHKGLMEN